MNEMVPNNVAFIESIPGYEIDRHLAQGGMASVYLATQTSLNRVVALKFLREFNDQSHQQRFLSESRIIASLNHRNIITIHDVGEFDGQAFLSMEFYEGSDLEARIAEGPLDACDALEVAASIGDALGFAHDHGIVHRDVKPGNILFHKDGTSVLTDFGIATDMAVDSKLTAIGTAIGTPTYVSPEQVQGNPTDGRSDIYSLGIVLYEMLVGAPPFQAASAIETMAAQVSLPAPHLPDELSNYQLVLDRMIAKRKEDRFATAQEMVAALRDIQFDLQDNSYQTNIDDFTHSLRITFDEIRDFFDEQLRQRNVRIGGAMVGFILVAWLGIATFSEPDPVDLLLNRAEQAVADDKLAYPVKGSALKYYREALAIDAENDDALDGLHDIAEIYADRAEQDLIGSNFPSAKFNIDRGLQAEPANPRLRQLGQDTKGLRKLPEKVFRGIRSLFE